MEPGARYEGGGRCRFTVWAPKAETVEVKLGPGGRDAREARMEKAGRGYWTAVQEDVEPGALYSFVIDGSVVRPDPASHHQPSGMHGPSAVVDHDSFTWTDDGWEGIPLEEMVLYELHVGTFTPEGTFDAAAERLDEIKDLGVNTVEVMPVAQFPGTRNWGYDGAFPYAVQDSYGGPDGLKRLVDACHSRGMAVTLDVVYNHLGPEGNYLRDFGPYFTDHYRTPWGEAVNFDGPHSNEVREYFTGNALHWFGDYHVDALRLDAVHAIYDMSAKPFLKVLADRVREYSEKKGRKFYLVAEDDLNDARLVEPPGRNGLGLDGEWSDDFHHCLHTLLTGESDGYYADFGRVADLAKAMTEGHVLSGQYSEYRKRDHGSPSTSIPAGRFVVFGQNHDQVGNRALGERLTGLVSFESLKLGAAVVMLSPFVPLIFMGEEYGETNPFLYFVSHGDADLVEAVREGRKREFSSFHAEKTQPDPQSEETFGASVLGWEKRRSGRGAVLVEYYKELLRLRRGVPALATLDKETTGAAPLEGSRTLLLTRRSANSSAFAAFNFSDREVYLDTGPAGGPWRLALDSALPRWEGPGSIAPETTGEGGPLTVAPESVVLYLTEEQG